jgi:hypothetical protein
MHPMVVGQFGFEPFDGLLDLGGAANRLDRAEEFGNHAVARTSEYSAFVLADKPVDQLAAVLKKPISPFFVDAHHAGEAHTIGA